MSRDHKCLSQLAIERYLLGEGTSIERAQVELAIDVCETCAAAIADTRTDNEAFAFRPIPAGIRELWSVSGSADRWPRLLIVALPVAVAAVIAAVLVVPGLLVDAPDIGAIPEIGHRGSDDSVRPKGIIRTDDASPGSDPSLGFYILQGSGTALGKPGQPLREGDRIQFWYEVPKAFPGVVVGIDSRRTVTRYFPAPGEPAAVLKHGQGHVVKSSVVLDDAPGVERFFLCVGEGILAADVEGAAQRLAASGIDLEQVERLPIDCAQASTWIRKE